jgi:3'(2'), 5'-bisphosphate nucleotidase
MSSSPEQLSDWLTALIEIAEAAGREIMRIYGTAFSVNLKSDHSPITEADLSAQRIIAAGLQRITPQIPMLGEESPPQLFEQRRQWPRLWLVDPLDGTREFVKRNGEFTVNIALVEEFEPVLGVLYAPARAVLYGAARGCGAFRRTANGQRTVIHAQSTAPARLRVLGSRSHGDAALDRMLERLGDLERLHVGSALKFGLLAEGSGDLYVRRGPTFEWDTAAGQALVLEAGGVVVDLHGAPLRYNARAELRNPSFIAYADRSRDWVALLSSVQEPI